MQASDKSVQDACFESLRQNPDVFAAFSSLAAQHGVRIAIDPSHTTRRLALEGGGSVPASTTKARPGLGGLLDSVGRAFGDVGNVISAYMRRMQRRINRLLTMLSLRDAELGEDAKDVDGEGDQETMLFDVVFSSATLIVICALLGRILRA